MQRGLEASLDKARGEGKVCPLGGRPLMLICPRSGANLSRSLSEIFVFFQPMHVS